jgi:hypothetical protein
MRPVPFLWLCVVGSGVILLGLIRAYGMRRHRKRTPAEKAATGSATRQDTVHTTDKAKEPHGIDAAPITRSRMTASQSEPAISPCR